MRGRPSIRLFRSVATLAVLGAGGACGAKSGLDVPLVREDGGFDAAAQRTVRRDAAPDTGHDAGVDAFVRHSPPPGLDCAEEGVTYIYVIGSDNRLYAFHPDSGAFDLIGVIDCPAEPGASPFSMAVDHLGVAYVVFDHSEVIQNPNGKFTTVSLPGDGALFRVSTRTASCEATPFVPGQHGITTFGMGFAANPVDGGVAGETLYVASDRTNELATIDLTTFEVKPVAPFGKIDKIQVQAAELTGTGAGGLWGLFAVPVPVGGQLEYLPPSYIVHLNPLTGSVLSGVKLPDVGEGNAWAFGFWGGDFYTFTAPGNTTQVTRYRPSDGSVVLLAAQPPFGVEIVGAGVSTCAPQE